MKNRTEMTDTLLVLLPPTVDKGADEGMMDGIYGDTDLHLRKYAYLCFVLRVFS